jgi:hypothetical protein
VRKWLCCSAAIRAGHYHHQQRARHQRQHCYWSSGLTASALLQIAATYPPAGLLPVSYHPLPAAATSQVIITTSNVLVINPEDENVLPFITELKMKISQPSLAVSGSYPSALNDLGSGGGAKVVIPSRSVAKLETLASLQMPFELKALEVCLDSVSARFGNIA